MNFTFEQVLFPIDYITLALRIASAGLLMIFVASPIAVGFWITWKRFSYLHDAVLDKPIRNHGRSIGDKYAVGDRPGDGSQPPGTGEFGGAEGGGGKATGGGK